MDRVETPTEELLRGIARALEAEIRDIGIDCREANALVFLRASVLDCHEAISGGDV